MFRKILPLCLLLSLVGAVALAKPGQVIIIRHGEKPAEGDDLTVKGRERAAALAPFFQDGDYRPVAIYACSPSEEHHSRRCVETATPLAEAMKMTLKTFHHGDFAPMAKEILSCPEYDGKIVLICWSHKEIPAVAAALGVADPPKWRGEVFDRLWIIRFSDGKATMHDAPQRLLYDDSAK